MPTWVRVCSPAAGHSVLNATSAATTVKVDGGSLTLSAAQRLSAAPVVTLAAGGSLVLAGDETFSGLAGAGGLSLNATTLRTGSSADSSYTGSISGTGNLVKQGTGTFTLGGLHSYSGSTTVTAGTLALAAPDRLPDSTAVAVAAGAALQLAGDETVATLALAGTLSGNGTLNANSYALDSGSVLASLGAGSLQSIGSSSLVGSSAANTVQVISGTLALAAAEPPGRCRQRGWWPAAPRSPWQATTASPAWPWPGPWAASGTLSAGTYTLNSGTVIADLGSGALSSAGSSRLDGRSAATTLTVDSGSLTLGAADRLADSMALSVASGAALVINAADTRGQPHAGRHPVGQWHAHRRQHADGRRPRRRQPGHRHAHHTRQQHAGRHGSGHGAWWWTAARSPSPRHSDWWPCRPCR